MAIKEYIVASTQLVEEASMVNALNHCEVFYTRDDAEKAALERTKRSIKLGYFERNLVFEATHQTERLGDREARLVEVAEQ